jgi:hypothetical protein
MCACVRECACVSACVYVRVRVRACVCTCVRARARCRYAGGNRFELLLAPFAAETTARVTVKALGASGTDGIALMGRIAGKPASAVAGTVEVQIVCDADSTDPACTGGTMGQLRERASADRILALCIAAGVVWVGCVALAATFTLFSFDSSCSALTLRCACVQTTPIGSITGSVASLAVSHAWARRELHISCARERTDDVQ